MIEQDYGLFIKIVEKIKKKEEEFTFSYWAFPNVGRLV